MGLFVLFIGLIFAPTLGFGQAAGPNCLALFMIRRPPMPKAKVEAEKSSHDGAPTRWTSDERGDITC